MKKISCRTSLMLLALAALIFAANGPVYADWTLTDLGAGVSPNDINNSGQIVGSLSSGTTFLYSGGTVQSLSNIGTALGATRTTGTAINDSGVIAGNYTISGNAWNQGYVYNPSTGVATGLGGLSNYGAIVRDINNAGQVVGISMASPSNMYHAFTYSSGTMTDIGTWGQSYVNELYINNTGKIAGTGINNDTGNQFGFISSTNGTGAVNIGNLGSIDGNVWTAVRGMNDLASCRCFILDGT